MGTLYFLRIFADDEEFFKVGITLKSVKKRFGYKGALNGYKYEVLATYTSANAAAVYDWEQSILETFSHLRYTPKIRFGGESECFCESEEILACFPL